MFVRRSLAGLLLLPILALAAGVSGNAEAPAAAPSSTPLAAPTILRSPAPEPSVTPAPSVTSAPSPASPVPSGAPSPSGSASPRTGLSALFALPVPSSAPTQPYATFIKGADRQSGVIDIIRKEDDLYFDLKPENFGKPYIILPSLATGVGGNAFAGRIYDPMVVVFRRVGKRILWITPNSRYVADKGSAAAASLAISVADSVVQSTPVIAEDPAKTHVVIAPGIFLTDFEGIGADLGKSAAPAAPPAGLLILFAARPSFSVDSTKSYYVRTKAFPRNDEISVNLTFNGPPNALPTVPDGRGIPIVVHYSIVAPPDTDKSYVPRYADDRIGYFITARKRYGTNADSPFERFIERWNLHAGPIVFTLTREIPQQYRGTVRRAILNWNVAFAKIGYPHAIEVNDPPSDPNWDPEDARYNSVRWITSDTSDFVAISPHFADPANGQIIQASVVIDGESVRSVHRGFIDRVLPVRRTRDAAARYAAAIQGAPVTNAAASDGDDDAQGVDTQSCDYGETSVSQASVGMTALAAHHHATEADRDRYTQEWLTAVVMHEVGHTLGLRHNFQGSTAFTYAQIHDPAFTRVHGTSGSVMDYNPANIAAPKERQADYFDTKLGPYDYWAIRYGYMKLNAPSSYDELLPLRHLAAQSTQPGLAYGTDEDVVDPFDLDPRIQLYDLSNDMLKFAQVQFAIDDDVARSLTQTYRGDARTYQDIRQTFVSILNNELGAAELAAHYVGGIYTSRAHRGQRGAAAPFRPIPRGEQRRAFGLIADHIFSSRAFQYPPQLLNELTPARFGFHWHSGVSRTDFPIREVAEEIQDDSVSALFSPGVMSRLADQSLKAAHPGDTMSLADLFTWSNAAIYDDIGKPAIGELHRELQRRFTDLQIEIAFLPAGAMSQLSLPRETQALARYELRQLNGRLAGAYRNATDTATRAHIDDLRSRVGSSLNPKADRSI